MYEDEYYGIDTYGCKLSFSFLLANHCCFVGTMLQCSFFSVVEAFFLNDMNQYLEVEVGP